jgi:hypothetical protein
MSPTLKHQGPIHLRFDAGKVVVTPEDQDRFVLASESAVQACQIMNASLQLRERFKEEFLAGLFRWCQDHADKVGECYVAISHVLSVFIVGTSGKYDFSLDDPISDLEMAMDEKGWSCDILQLPSNDTDSLKAFFNKEQSILVYAQRR